MRRMSNAETSPISWTDQRRASASGIEATMPAKMMSEMPLPMPRSVICSPSHMMNAVPVVSETMVIRRKAQPGLATTSPTPPLSEPP